MQSKLQKIYNTPKLPKTMFQNNIEIPKNELLDIYAEFFESKVKSIVGEQVISDTVYNGECKIACNESNFMTELDIFKVIKTTKPKNFEGRYRVPVRILFDCIQIISKPLAKLFNKIYEQKRYLSNGLFQKLSQFTKRGTLMIFQITGLSLNLE